MPDRTPQLPDELLDELFTSLTVLGRTMAKHKMLDEQAHLDVKRMLILRLIADAGLCRVSDIAHYLAIKAPATTAIIDDLESDGFVVREHSTDDKRVVNIRLTETGQEWLACAEVMRRHIMRKRLGVLSEDEIRTLIAIQHKLIDVMADGE